jgi:hypothetical protein
VYDNILKQNDKATFRRADREKQIDHAEDHTVVPEDEKYDRDSAVRESAAARAFVRAIRLEVALHGEQITKEIADCGRSSSVACSNVRFFHLGTGYGRNPAAWEGLDAVVAESGFASSAARISALGTRSVNSANVSSPCFFALVNAEQTGR